MLVIQLVLTNYLQKYSGINSNNLFLQVFENHQPLAGGFFLYLCAMEKEHQIFGIRAIIEAIQEGAKVY
jgi:hypothetical protein